MNILFWTDGFWPRVGGVEVHALTLIEKLQKFNYKFLVFAQKDNSNFESEEIYRFINIKRFNFNSIIESKKLTELKVLSQALNWALEHFKPDIIHLNCSANSSALAYLLIGRKLSIPVILNMHVFSVENNFVHPLTYNVLSNVDHICCVSGSLLQQVKNKMPSIQDKSCYIYNGLPIPDQLPTPLLFTPATLVCLGRLEKQKGFDLAIQAFSRLTSKFPALQLIIAGDGSERTYLENLAKELGVDHKITFTGYVAIEDIPMIMNRATIGIMPSRFEPFGLVALHVAHMERPIIATKIDGLAEIVIDQETGLLIPVDDECALANAIETLLNNPELSIKMGKKARERAISFFSENQMVENYKIMYENVLNNKKINV